MRGEPLNIRLTAPEWSPPGYDSAPAERKRRWWMVLGHAALIVKRAEILRGVGVLGPLLPVKRRKGGPPLIPHGVSSRTYRLLALRVGSDGATLFWYGGWKTILGYHAYKHGPRSLPVRDTIGISPGGRRKVMSRALAEWERWRSWG